MPRADEKNGSFCYFIVCFQEPEFVAFLLASLYRQQDLFLVHCDIKAPQKLKNYLQALTNRYTNIILFPCRSYSWAGFSHVQLTLEAMEQALKQERTWSHFFALSEQHLPLKSPSQIALFLESRKTMLDMRPVKQMGGAENQDISNRFGAYYKELPGVGCFAVGVADRRELLETVHHGTNWFTVHRTHCQVLVESFSSGAFEPFKSVLHAEETAIQTMLVPLSTEIEQHDTTLVAFPHLTDNHSLVMNDKLFESAIGTSFLFIRKRTKNLSPFIINYIINNHFDHEIYNILTKIKSTGRSEEEFITSANLAAENIRSKLEEFGPNIFVERINSKGSALIPKIYLILKHPTLLAKKICVRVLSENLLDFKVLIDREQEFPASFAAPFEQDGYLHSTIRSRVYGLFGCEEILPMSEPYCGFVTIGLDKTMADVIETARRFLAAALVFSKTYNPARNFEPTTVVAAPEDDKVKEQPMSRSQRLNVLAKLVGAKRYLEVGVCEGETFFEVDVNYKVAVDPNFRFDFKSKETSDTVFHQISSDAYFGEITETAPFDLIYLDGLHTFEQTLRDFLNSMRYAHEKTVWLLDDTVPTNAFAALPNEHECGVSRSKVGIEDWSWMGDVYKVVFFIRQMMPFFNFRTYSGHGQTVIWNGKLARPISPTPSWPMGRIGNMQYTDVVRDLDEMIITPDEQILDAIRKDLLVPYSKTHSG